MESVGPVRFQTWLGPRPFSRGSPLQHRTGHSPPVPPESRRVTWFDRFTNEKEFGPRKDHTPSLTMVDLHDFDERVELTVFRRDTGLAGMIETGINMVGWGACILHVGRI